MNKYIKSFIESQLKIRYTLVFAIIISFVIGVGLHNGYFSLWPLYRLRENIENHISKEEPIFKSIPSSNLKKLEAVWDLIRYNYLYDEISEEDMIDSQIQGIVNNLDDNFSHLKLVEKNTDKDEAPIGVIGVFLAVKDNYVYFSNVLENGPAYKAEIKKYDIPIKINDEIVIGKSSAEMKELLTGKPNTNVDILLLRPDEQTTYQKTIKRELKLEDANVTIAEEDDTGIYILKINSFSDDLYKEYKKALSKIDTEIIKGLVIDLRDNTGGNLAEAKKVIETMIEEDKLIVRRVDRNGEETLYISEESNYPDLINLPKVILVNSVSASCSEITAIALRTHQGTKIIGTTTYGKGVTTSDYQISDSEILNLVTANWYGPNDEYIHEIGVTPDIIAEENSEDKAIEIILKQI